MVSAAPPRAAALPLVSHYADGRIGALWENSLAIALIVLIVLLPWRPGADPAFYADDVSARRRAFMGS